MANLYYWKTGAGLSRRERVRWPSAAQAIRQLAIAAAITAVWGGLLAVYLLAGSGGTPAAVAVEAEPSTFTPTLPPADTPTATPTATPTGTSTATPDAPAASGAGTQAPGGEPAPSATLLPTETLPPTATPTHTPLPPTDTPQPVAEESAAGVSFAGDVFPIIERRCIKCHGGPKEDGSLRIEEGLDMRTYAGLLAGSWNGPVIEPGDAERSYLVEQIVEGKMPKKEPRLLPGEIRAIRAWIDAGAPDN